MVNKKLGTLSNIDIREIWNHEALDFTPWLAKEENIELLSDEVGIDMQILQTEAHVGSFGVDILAEEENTGRKIIIENQLETTDHIHLGQLITYAAGLEAEYIIWIVRDVREEHLQAVDWLNEHTDNQINFFLVAIQVWQIGDSPFAPKFNVISRPNEWKRSVKTSSQDGELSDTKIKQLEFWEEFKRYGSSITRKIRFRKPRPQHWYDIAIGRSDCHISLVTDSRENQVRCDLYIRDSKELFKTFFSNKDSIEEELDMVGKLKWLELPSNKASRISCVKGFSFSNSETWESAHKWLIETSIKFKRIFGKDWKLNPEGVTEDLESE